MSPLFVYVAFFYFNTSVNEHKQTRAEITFRQTLQPKQQQAEMELS